MYTPVVRMVDAALRHATLGVGPQLTSMVADGSDTKPGAPTIINTVDHDSAAQGPPQDPGSAPIDEYPALVIAAETPSKIEITGVLGKAFDIPNLMVHVVYVTGDTGDPAEAWRAADYTFRAVVHALNAALFASNTAAARVRGTVQILKKNEITYGPAFSALSKGRIIGILTLDLHARVNP